MGKTLYLDCFAGAAGDMLLGALIDLGFDAGRLDDLAARLGLTGVRVTVARVMRGAIQAPLLRVEAPPEQPHRHWAEIDERLAAAELPAPVRDNARRVFRRLAEAEAAIHGHSPHHVHFHEVGAVDALIDIVGFCLAIYELEIERIIASPLPLGRGQTDSAHGTIPLPAPATVALLGDAPVYAYPLEVETVTPTGAALISTLAAGFAAVPAMTLLAVGYGAGTRVDAAGPPNVVRALLGLAQTLPETAETTFTITANIDDMNPEYYEPLARRLEENGALDVTLIPCVMKHGRPGILLEVLAPQSKLEELIETVFVHSTTLGLRYYPTARAVCERRVETIEAPFGKVRIKHAYYRGQLVHSKPEYADLMQSGLPIAEALRLLAEAKKGR